RPLGDGAALALECALHVRIAVVVEPQLRVGVVRGGYPDPEKFPALAAGPHVRDRPAFAREVLGEAEVDHLTVTSAPAHLIPRGLIRPACYRDATLEVRHEAAVVEADRRHSDVANRPVSRRVV